MTNWKKLNELQEPFNDAVNYRTRQEKEFFNKIFLRTDDLSECLKPNIYYLIGEKGSGKTAYAAYLENNDVEKARCKLSTMTETQYKRFIMLKRAGKLDYSDYANIWRPMLLNMVSQALISKSKGFLESFTGKFDVIEEEIAKFNAASLNPEVEVAFEMVTEASAGATLGAEKIAQIDARVGAKETNKSELIKHHLLAVEVRSKHAISDLRLAKNHVLFIDGIDYRPEGIRYSDYLACVKGLGEAVWQLNTEFFANIRDSKGRIKVVLLVRPDVFHALNLYNSNSRLHDNSVFLSWSTTEQALRDSSLYAATGKYFSSQQTEPTSPLDAADHYLRGKETDHTFQRILRSSFHKPRDILTFIKISRRISMNKLGLGDETQFPVDITRDADVTKEYADYLLGEIRNYSAFYMEANDFNLYLKFFQYLDGAGEFQYEAFSAAFRKFKNWIRGEHVKATEYLRDSEALLQFFYDVNLIGYRENVGDKSNKFYHFSFRERSLNNLAPKIKTTGILMVGYGIGKALDIGLQSKQKNLATPGARQPLSAPAGRRQNFGDAPVMPAGKPRRRTPNRNRNSGPRPS
jgi:hypothetical protein